MRQPKGIWMPQFLAGLENRCRTVDFDRLVRNGKRHGATFTAFVGERRC